MGIIVFHNDADEIEISTQSIKVGIILGNSIAWYPNKLNCQFVQKPVFRIRDNYGKSFEIIKREKTFYFKTSSNYESWIEIEAKLSALDANRIYTELLAFLRTYSSTATGSSNFEIDPKDLMKQYRIKNNQFPPYSDEEEESEEEEYVMNGRKRISLRSSK